MIERNLRGYFELCFIIANVDNLDTKLQGYLKLSFIMEEVDSLLDAKL